MYTFTGKWITDQEFCDLAPRNVFHKQLAPIKLPCDEHRNRHILFRKTFTYTAGQAIAYITADDYYKLYVNGQFAGQGPAPSYHFQYNYNGIDITPYLHKGENTIAVHTLYQGLINRVWQSGDQRHGMILDIVADGEVLCASDETFLTKPHGGYREIGIAGYQTQYLEEYDSRCADAWFMCPDYDDSAWDHATLHHCDDHQLTPQTSGSLVFESIAPTETQQKGDTMFIDFGKTYVGYLNLRATGPVGSVVTIRCGQELNADGTVRFQLRANCNYEETWILGEGESVLDWFDYKAFRYAEVVLPEGAALTHTSFAARHYPFSLKNEMKAEYRTDPLLQKIWELCVHSQQYGIQEVIQDCMEREKGFYLGDGCYTALTHMILTGDDSMVRKLIDDAFATTFITEGLVTCMDCSFMQEIAEYPLILIYLVLWHYNYTGQRDYLAQNYPKCVRLLESYRQDYEKDYILTNLDKWCVVEWPSNFRDGYAVDITEGKVCEEAHVSINAYYVAAVETTNTIAAILGEPAYRNDLPEMKKAFWEAFWMPEVGYFRDGVKGDHVSLPGNVFPFGLGLCPDAAAEAHILALILDRKLSAVSLFCPFLVLMRLAELGREDIIRDMLTEEGTWSRMLREGATSTFEGWGMDTKWNTSLFHLTMSYGALYLADVELAKLFGRK